MPFSNPYVGGDGTLVINQIKSQNFNTTAHTGWQISKDGSAIFYNSITGENLLLGPLNLGATPYLNLVKLFKMMGEIATPSWNNIAALYTTTSAYADPGFGTLSLPLSSSFTGTGAANVKIETFFSLNSSGAVPSGVFGAQVLKDGVVISGTASTTTVQQQAANVRMPLYAVWDEQVTYVSGVPQESFTVQVKDSAGPNHWNLHSDSKIRTTVTIDPQYFLQA